MKPLLGLLLVTFSSACLADTIRLRNGTNLEGVIVGEEDDHYVAMVQVTKTIRDQRKIPKEDVIEIIGVEKDQVAFESIKNLLPTPDLLGPEEYERRIENVEAFLTEHSSSPLVGDAKAILVELEKEAKAIDAEGIKFEGKIIPADERASKAYSLDSKIAANAVTTAGDAGRRTEALRAWRELETNFLSSRAFLDTKPYAIQLMKSQLAAINNELSTFDQRMKERTDGIERIPAKDRSRTEAILQEQSDKYLAILAAEKEAKIRWISLDPSHKAPMTEMKSLLEREIKRLEGLSTSQLPDGDHAWQEAWSTLNGTPTPEEAREAINLARKSKLPASYLDRLSEKLPK